MKPLTTRSLGIGLVLSVVTTMAHSYANVNGHNIALGFNEEAGWPCTAINAFGYAGPVLGINLMLLAVMRVLPKKHRFNSAEMVFVLTCMMAAPVMTGFTGFASNRWWTALSHQYSTQPARIPTIQQYLTPYLWPKDQTVVAPMRTGGASVPWDAWMVPLAFQMSFFLIFYLFLFFGSCLIQEQYVDAEALAFPLATVSRDMMRLVALQEAEEDKGLLKDSLFRNLFIVGFAFYYGYNIISSNVGGMNLYYRPMSSINPLAYDFTPYNWIDAPLLISVDPVSTWLGFLLIAPMSLLVTTPLVQIILFMILPPALILMGQLPRWSPGQTSGYLHYVVIGTNSGAVPAGSHFTYGYGPFMMGIIFGMAIVPIIFQRTLLTKSIRAAISGEKGGWISMRLVWGGWALTCLATIALLTVVEFPIYYAVFFLALSGLFYLGHTRLATSSGVEVFSYQQGYCSMQGQWVNYFGLWSFGMAGQNNAATYNVAAFGNAIMGGRNNGYQMSQPMNYELESFKLAQLTNADRKQMTVSMLIGSLVPLVVGFPLAIWLVYRYGYLYVGAAGNTSRTLSEGWNSIRAVPPIGGGLNPQPETYPIFFLGIITVWLLTFARRRFAGPLAYILPAGFIFAWYHGYNVWIMCIIVAVIRFSIYKVGGTKMYDKWVYPLALGMMVSAGLKYIVEVALWNIISVGVRWW